MTVVFPMVTVFHMSFKLYLFSDQSLESIDTASAY
jgi:hypothetical protein